MNKNPLVFFCIFCVKAYSYLLSPIIGKNCRFFPTCSEYFIEALKTQGLKKGFVTGSKRILKCHPFKSLGGGQGVDFVPIPKNANRHERLKKIIDGLQKAGWKYNGKKESKDG